MLQKGQGKSNAGAPLGQAELSCTYQQWQVQKHRVQSWLLQADGSMQSESDTSQLGQPCCTFAHSLGSVWAKELMQRFLCVCDSAFLWNGRLFRLPTHPAFGKMYSPTAQSSRESFPAVSNRQVSTLGELAGLQNVPGSNAAGTQTQLCVSSTRKIQLNHSQSFQPA